MGYKKQVVILTRDMSYRKKPMNKLLIRSFYGKFPDLCNALENRHNVYNESIDKLCELEQSGKVFIIRPSEPITISRTERDPDRLKSVYELGRKDMEMYLKDLEEFLEKEQEI